MVHVSIKIYITLHVFISRGTILYSYNVNYLCRFYVLFALLLIFR